MSDATTGGVGDERAHNAAAPMTAEALVLELAALQARQGALRDALAKRNFADVEAVAAAEETVCRIPEYVAKLHRVQQSMDTLAARTSQMRARCDALLREQ